jgi:hypothetical protein
MSVVRLPRITSYAPRIVLMTMEDGGLGFAQVDLNCTLRIWSMKIRPDGGAGADGDTRVWVISRAIDLKTQLFTPRQLPPHALGFDASPLCVVVAFADGAGVIFLKTNDGLYSFDLKSDPRQAVKVDMSSGFYDIIPYMSFYTPGTVHRCHFSIKFGFVLLYRHAGSCSQYSVWGKFWLVTRNYRQSAPEQ